MEIKNVRIYGLEESIIASGYPRMIEMYTEEKFDNKMEELYCHIHEVFHTENADKDIKRATNLAQTLQGSGHSCYLKGAIVQYDLTAPEYFWRQFDRYHFHDYISSNSKMYCITKFDIKKMCNKYVDNRIIEILENYISTYNDLINDGFSENQLKKVFQQIISNCPMGLELTARITDNYLQLKSKYIQRRHHKLEEWQYYCDWIETLPMAEKLIIPKKEDK